jgi:putative sterol carrier protein
MSTVAEIALKLPEIFNPKKAKGYNRVIQLDVTGEGGGKYFLVVKDREMNVFEGEPEKAHFTMTIGAEDFVEYFEGRAKPMDLVRSGRLKFTGPMTEGMAFNAIWNLKQK